MITPDDPGDDKARHLRAIYRDVGEAGHATVAAEFDRLYPGEDRQMLAHILTSAWTEGRELAGQRYDRTAQCWRDAEGNRVD